MAMTQVDPILSNGAWSHDDPFNERNPYIASLLARDVYQRHAWPGASALHASNQLDDYCEAMARLGASECEIVDGAGDLVYALLVAGPSVILVFRGSNSPANWIADLISLHTKTVYDLGGSQGGGVNVAAGFYSVFSANKEAIAERVKRAMDALDDNDGANGGKRLWIVGHSLGGAVALMTAAYLDVQEGLGATAVYTYGCPKVGDVSWVKAYRQHDITLRFENSGDLVPTMPFWANWRHVGLERDVGGCSYSRNALHRQPQSTALALLPSRRALHGTSVGMWLGQRQQRDRILGSKQDGADNLGIREHLVGAYVQSMWDCLPGQQRRGLPSPSDDTAAVAQVAAAVVLPTNGAAAH